MRILVTGGRGLIGRAMTERLVAEGDEVVNFDRLAPTVAAPGIIKQGETTCLGDLYQAAQGADAIVHLAAIPEAGVLGDDTVFSNNTLGLFNVLKIAADLKISRLVSASSATIWGLGAETCFAPQWLPLTESYPDNPQNAYALSKMVGEVLVTAACKTTALIAYSLRLTLVLSEANWKVEGLPRLQHPERGKEIVFAYVWIDDVVEAISRSLRSPGSPGSHQILAINGPDVLADDSPEILYHRFYHGVPWNGGTSFIDTRRAYETIGFVPQHSWHRMAPSRENRHA
ncbi:MAG: hypothetical protein C7B46_13735 [Sulfobacillus benefaciens]|uniref:NAD-dependent epimerase/dehydratase domain-containing protein n=1 Tax=Sulfobacillus benefaciens TaxID=453960 RepID=A0A2T2XDP7_9FIRM|nr:MAG: hypothetical protein C7B46_13735 [Sulfobacillus benefaciens]